MVDQGSTSSVQGLPGKSPINWYQSNSDPVTGSNQKGSSSSCSSRRGLMDERRFQIKEEQLLSLEGKFRNLCGKFDLMFEEFEKWRSSRGVPLDPQFLASLHSQHTLAMEPPPQAPPPPSPPDPYGMFFASLLPDYSYPPMMTSSFLTQYQQPHQYPTPLQQYPPPPPPSDPYGYSSPSQQYETPSYSPPSRLYQQPQQYEAPLPLPKPPQQLCWSLQRQEETEPKVFDEISVRKIGSTSWCRRCKIDCESMEGLVIHSLTSEHQNMTMALVLNIKKNIQTITSYASNSKNMTSGFSEAPLGKWQSNSPMADDNAMEDPAMVEGSSSVQKNSNSITYISTQDDMSPEFGNLEVNPDTPVRFDQVEIQHFGTLHKQDTPLSASSFQNSTICQMGQSMLELLHKVDQSRNNNTFLGFGNSNLHGMYRIDGSDFPHQHLVWDPGPYAWVHYVPGEPIPKSRPNGGSMQGRKWKKHITQRKSFILSEKNKERKIVAVARGKAWAKHLVEWDPGIQNFEEYQVSSISVGVVGDICHELEENALPYCDGIMSNLLKDLSNPVLHMSVKPPIFPCFEDIALAIGEHFEKYIQYALPMLKIVVVQCVSLGASDEDMLDYGNQLRRGIFEAYSGILQGFKSSKADLMLPQATHSSLQLWTCWCNGRKNDKLKLLRLGSLQHLGENMLTFLFEVSTSPNLHKELEIEAERSTCKSHHIFFDVLEMHMVVYSKKFASMLYNSVILQSLLWTTSLLRGGYRGAVKFGISVSGAPVVLGAVAGQNIGVILLQKYFCDTCTPRSYVDIAIPANNKEKQSIGCLLWLLARMVPAPKA